MIGVGSLRIREVLLLGIYISLLFFESAINRSTVILFLLKHFINIQIVG